MNHIANSVFITLLGNYIESREEYLMSIREEMALNEIMHWNPEKAIIYLMDKYPGYVEKLNNLNTINSLSTAIQVEIIEKEVERIIENMVIT